VDGAGGVAAAGAAALSLFSAEGRCSIEPYCSESERLPGSRNESMSSSVSVEPCAAPPLPPDEGPDGVAGSMDLQRGGGGSIAPYIARGEA